MFRQAVLAHGYESGIGFYGDNRKTLIEIEFGILAHVHSHIVDQIAPHFLIPRSASNRQSAPAFAAHGTYGYGIDVP
jgi:hypothetical protein